MDPDSGADTQRTLSLQWKSYKLVQDPALRRVAQKIYRYDGIHFNAPVWTCICTSNPPKKQSKESAYNALFELTYSLKNIHFLHFVYGYLIM